VYQSDAKVDFINKQMIEARNSIHKEVIWPDPGIEEGAKISPQIVQIKNILAIQKRIIREKTKELYISFYSLKSWNDRPYILL
jgi:hypothetical protein